MDALLGGVIALFSAFLGAFASHWFDRRNDRRAELEKAQSTAKILKAGIESIVSYIERTKETIAASENDAVWINEVTRFVPEFNNIILGLQSFDAHNIKQIIGAYVAIFEHTDVLFGWSTHGSERSVRGSPSYRIEKRWFETVNRANQELLHHLRLALSGINYEIIRKQKEIDRLAGLF